MRASDGTVKPGVDERLQSRGTSQSGVRLHNERLVLSLIRLQRGLPKAEIARFTGLSPQTISVIVRQLERDGLVLKGKAMRGKVGQPRQPFSLNPDGAFSIGLKVGRRSGELMLVDLEGKVRQIIQQPYAFPLPQTFLDFATNGIHRLVKEIGPERANRISGLGVAAPFDIWNWEEEANAPHDVMEAWRRFDLETAMREISPWPVHYCNDATAACVAELFFGGGKEFQDFAYIYCGYFVGGGFAIGGKVQQGRTGNAGALGSMLVPKQASVGGEQLIRSASLYLLEGLIHRSGQNANVMWTNAEDWSEAEYEVEKWIATASRSLAHAVVNLAAIIECKAVLIDGAMPANVRRRLLVATRKHLTTLNCDGISRFTVEEGSCGAAARALGAACLPLIANFMVDRDVFWQGGQAETASLPLHI